MAALTKNRRQITPAEWEAMSWHARLRARRKGLAPFVEDIGRPEPRPVVRRGPMANPMPQYRIRVEYAWDDAGTWVVSDGHCRARCGSWEVAYDFARRVARSLPRDTAR